MEAAHSGAPDARDGKRRAQGWLAGHGWSDRSGVCRSWSFGDTAPRATDMFLRRCDLPPRVAHGPARLAFGDPLDPGDCRVRFDGFNGRLDLREQRPGRGSRTKVTPLRHPVRLPNRDILSW